MEEIWKRKIKAVVKISEKYGYPEYNAEFWKHQIAKEASAG